MFSSWWPSPIELCVLVNYLWFRRLLWCVVCAWLLVDRWSLTVTQAAPSPHLFTVREQLSLSLSLSVSLSVCAHQSGEATLRVMLSPGPFLCCQPQIAAGQNTSNADHQINLFTSFSCTCNSSVPSLNSFSAFIQRGLSFSRDLCLFGNHVPGCFLCLSSPAQLQGKTS